jgi:hypothetical protein
MSYSIHDAGEADLPGILAIYNDAVAYTTAIWNETLVDLANRRAWLTERTAAGFPVLVARDAAGGVLGYASYGTCTSWSPPSSRRTPPRSACTSAWVSSPPGRCPRSAASSAAGWI